MNDIIEAQKALNIPQSGVVDELTSAALRNYQSKNGLIAHGLLDEATIEKLLPGVGGELDTDFFSKPPVIHTQFLSPGQFLSPSKKRYIFLHHTAGWNNPYAVISDWNRDARGPIGTQYVIGGPNISTGDPKYDGEIVQCMKDDQFGWHLGIGNTAVHRESIGIELCNFGWLTLNGYTSLKTGKWISKPPGKYTYTGVRVQDDQVVDLGFDFRGFRYYHRYSDRQLDALRSLLPALSEKHGVDISKGLKQRLIANKDPRKAFEYSDAIRNGTENKTGLYCHSNVIKAGKWDINPQPEMIKLILDI